jgi:hypothetical protein
MITRFTIPTVVETILSSYDTAKVVNAVQSEINKGKNLGSTNSSKAGQKLVKNEDGNKRMVIVVNTKSGEKLQLEYTNPANFYSWCLAVSELNLWATTAVELPGVFKSWLDTFAKK